MGTEQEAMKSPSPKRKRVCECGHAELGHTKNPTKYFSGPVCPHDDNCKCEKYRPKPAKR